MDTITHGIAGALIAKAFFAGDTPAAAPSWLARPRNEDRVAIICATLGAVFPDVDVFFTFFSRDNLAFLTLHRGVTHSLLMLIIWAAALALLAGWLARLAKWPAPAFSQLFSIFGVALASHIFLDLLTSWGTMALSPLDHTRLTWDSLFIVDLTVTFFVLLPQLSAWIHGPVKRPAWVAPIVWFALSAAVFLLAPWVRSLDVPLSTEAAAGASVLFGVFLLVPLRRRERSRFGRVTWSRIGMTLLLGYIGFAAGMHTIALGQVRQYADEGHIDYESLAAVPLPPWPGRWAGLIATRQNVYRIQFNLLGGEAPRLDIYRSSAANNPYVTAARALPGVQEFLWFARFPLFNYAERDGNSVVQISDARFIGPRRSGITASVATPASNFTYEVVFAPDGVVISSGLARAN
jgi:membrane-bound metal-dependent hydrolase YbcI (DUF457 family)